MSKSVFLENESPHVRGNTTEVLNLIGKALKSKTI